MTIIGTQEEIDMLKNQCNGRCIHGEWCIFAECGDGCPIDSEGLCLEFETIKYKDGTTGSVLNER